MNRKLDLKGIGFFLAIVFLPAIAVFVSAWHLFPEMRWMTGLLLGITVGVALLIHWMTSEPVSWLRQLGILIGLVLCVTHAADLIAHVAYGRDISAATASKTERNADADKALAMERERAAIQKDLAAVETARIDAARRALVQTPMKDRGGLANRLLVPATAPIVTASATPTPSPGASGQQMTPEQVREYWQPVLLGLLVAGVGVSLIGGSAVYWARHWDGNGDNVPDWIEAVAKRHNESDFARGWPDEYKRYGSALAFAGKA
jgi:hypothetical protein